MSVQFLLAEAQAMDAIQKQVTLCNESLLSTRRMRTFLARSLGVTKYQAHLLVNQIVVKLCEKGVLEFWEDITRGKVYRINLERLAGIVPVQ